MGAAGEALAPPAQQLSTGTALQEMWQGLGDCTQLADPPAWGGQGLWVDKQASGFQ